MTNETNKQLSETKQLRGTFDQVIRQINETYNASNGWAIARTSSVLVNFSVWLERSVKQASPVERDDTPKFESKLVPTSEIVNTLETPDKQETVVTKPKTTAAKKTTEKKDV